MGGRNLIETIIGAVVLLVAAGFTMFAYNSSNIKPVTNGFNIQARFQTVGGLSIGGDVRIGGIKVGRVSAMRLNPDTYQAEITMEIEKNTPIPKDSAAAIVSDGLLGSKYVSIEPGAEDVLLGDGDTIRYTQSSVNIESLIGKMVHGSASGDE